MTTTRSWKIAVPRAAEDTLGVQASVLRVEESREVRDKLAGLVAENALIVLIEGAEERFGVAIVSPPVLSGFIEATTTGRIASRPVTPRVPTRTDAMIVADLLDAVLERFEANLAEMEDAPNLAGYRYAAPLGDARAMALTLADGPYSIYQLTLDLGGGVRQGEIAVAFPVAPKGTARQDVAAFQHALAENVMSAPSELEAVLHRVQMPLSQVTRLQAGDVLRVPLSALAAVHVAAVGGPEVARARLGQQGGFRAVRVTSVGGTATDPPAALEFHEAAPASPNGERMGFGGDAVPESAALAAMADAEGRPALYETEGSPNPSAAGDLPEIDGLPPLSG